MSSLTESLFGKTSPAAGKSAHVSKKAKKAGAGSSVAGKKKSASKGDATSQSVSADAVAAAFGSEAQRRVNAAELFKKAPVPTPKPRRTRDAGTKDAAAAKRVTGAKPSRSQRRSHLNQVPDHEENSRTVFVGNLPNNITARDVKKIFRGCGDIESARIRSIRLKPDDRKVDRGRAVRCLRGDIQEGDEYNANAFVLFTEAAAVEKAVRLTGTVHHERHIAVSREDASSKAFAPQTSVFLGNLDYRVGDEDIWAFFDANGVAGLERVRIVRDRETSMGKGFGYAEFKSPQVVSAAIALRGKELKGREVRMTHVQKIKNTTIAAEASRREKRRQKQDEVLESQMPHRKPTAAGKKHKKPAAEDTDSKTSGRRAAALETKANDDEEVPSWMGATANPRKKLARDLRILTQSSEDRKRILRDRKRQHFASKGNADGGGNAGGAAGKKTGAGSHKATKSGPQARKK